MRTKPGALTRCATLLQCLPSRVSTVCRKAHVICTSVEVHHLRPRHRQTDVAGRNLILEDHKGAVRILEGLEVVLIAKGASVGPPSAQGDLVVSRHRRLNARRRGVRARSTHSRILEPSLGIKVAREGNDVIVGVC